MQNFVCLESRSSTSFRSAYTSINAEIIFYHQRQFEPISISISFMAQESRIYGVVYPWRKNDQICFRMIKSLRIVNRFGILRES